MRLTIFKRLIIGNMIIISFVVFLGAYVVFKLDQLQRLSLNIINTDTKIITLCENLSDSLSSLVMFEKKFIISKDIDYLNEYNKVKIEFQKKLASLKDLLETPEDENAIQEVQSVFQKHSQLLMKEVEIIKDPPANYDSSTALSERCTLTRTIENALRQIIAQKNQIKDSKLLRSSLMIGKAINLTLIIAIISMVLGIIISVTNTRSITGPVFLLEQKTREISKGQFNPIPAIDTAPREIQNLTRYFNIMCLRLKELEVMKTDFISHFSHELRTPITSIKEAASILNMNLFHSEPEKEKELSHLILTECKNLTESIERILDLSKMEVFKMEWKFLKTDIVETTRTALDKFIPAAQNKNIDLKLIQPQKIPETRCDKKRIVEVINNLVSNAIKYTPENGKIIIEIVTFKNNSQIIVSVSDNGCGIDKKNLERIFEKFKRIDNGDDTLRGSGLGLAISKHIVNAHKGEIWAESEISKGTKISFVLPVV